MSTQKQATQNQKSVISRIWIYVDRSAWITRDGNINIDDQNKYNNLSDSSLDRLSRLSYETDQYETTFNYGGYPHQYPAICISRKESN